MLTYRPDEHRRKRELLFPSLYAVDDARPFEQAVTAFEAREIGVTGCRPQYPWCDTPKRIRIVVRQPHIFPARACFDT